MAPDEWKKMENSKTWDFIENPEMIGIYVSKEENVGENGSTVYTFETPDHEQVGVWGSTVLDTRLKRLTPGEEVKIVYLGLKDSPTRRGKQYKNFDVYHKPPPFTKVSNIDENDF